jgi:excisionase family DNA binding protein
MQTVAETEAPATIPQPPVFLTIAEISALLRVKRAQGYVLAAQGIFPSVRVGARGWRVPRVAWERWLAEQTALALANVKTTTYETAGSVH